MTKQFIADRKRGNVGANIVKEKMEAKGARVNLVPDGFYADYDLVGYHKGYAFCAEVKSDYRYKDTNNVAFEKEALEHSKTDIWFYVLDPEGKKEVHLIDRKKALEVAPRFRQGKFGEHSETVMLVPYSVFKSQLSMGML